MVDMKVEHILIADDDVDDINLLTEAILEYSPKVTVTYVTNGVKLLDKLKSGYMPDVLILDLAMPLKDGKWSLKEIRNNIEWVNLIIIVYTTGYSERMQMECLKLGANYFITKPTTMVTMRNIAREICEATFEFK